MSSGANYAPLLLNEWLRRSSPLADRPALEHRADD